MLGGRGNAFAPERRVFEAETGQGDGHDAKGRVRVAVGSGLLQDLEREFDFLLNVKFFSAKF